MKQTTRWTTVVFGCTFLLCCNVFAATKEDGEEVKNCIKPKFRDFFPVANSIVAPETDISFHVSRGSDIHSIKASVKGEKIPVTVKDKRNFIFVSAKLPASLRDGFARLHVEANATEGGCHGQDGWLIKIQENPAAPAKPETPQ